MRFRVCTWTAFILLIRSSPSRSLNSRISQIPLNIVGPKLMKIIFWLQPAFLTSLWWKFPELKHESVCHPRLPSEWKQSEWAVALLVERKLILFIFQFFSGIFRGCAVCCVCTLLPICYHQTKGIFRGGNTVRKSFVFTVTIYVQVQVNRSANKKINTTSDQTARAQKKRQKNIGWK